MTDRFHVVTTCSPKGWEETGRRMVESFLERWPPESKPLHLFAENFDPKPQDGLVVHRLPSWVDEFKAAHGKTPSKVGIKNGQYDYRYDAIRFCHKIAAIADFGAMIDDGVLIWLDCDTYTHSPVTTAWLDGLFPTGYIAWLDRLNNHPECGVIMFRASHPYHPTFMERIRDTYTSGGVFKLAQTHDSFVLQHLVMQKVGAGKIPPPVSLSGDARNSSHPAANGPISKCMDHLKGGRKVIGRTPKNERRTKDDIAYWA